MRNTVRISVLADLYFSLRVPLLHAHFFLYNVRLPLQPQLAMPLSSS